MPKFKWSSKQTNNLIISNDINSPCYFSNALNQYLCLFGWSQVVDHDTLGKLLAQILNYYSISYQRFSVCL